MGLDKVNKKKKKLHDQAFETLEYFGDSAEELVSISKFLLERKK